MTNRRMGKWTCCASYASVLAAAGFLAAGCGASGGTTPQGAPSIYPETVSLPPGGRTNFYAGKTGTDQHKASEGYRIEESDGGSFVTGANLIDDRLSPPPAHYIAPNQPGVYHIQYVWDAGTKDEKAATATITVSYTPPYMPTTL